MFLKHFLGSAFSTAFGSVGHVFLDSAHFYSWCVFYVKHGFSWGWLAVVHPVLKAYELFGGAQNFHLARRRSWLWFISFVLMLVNLIRGFVLQKVIDQFIRVERALFIVRDLLDEWNFNEDRRANVRFNVCVVPKRLARVVLLAEACHQLITIVLAKDSLSECFVYVNNWWLA